MYQCVFGCLYIPKHCSPTGDLSVVCTLPWCGKGSESPLSLFLRIALQLLPSTFNHAYGPSCNHILHKTSGAFTAALTFSSHQQGHLGSIHKVNRRTASTSNNGFTYRYGHLATSRQRLRSEPCGLSWRLFEPINCAGDIIGTEIFWIDTIWDDHLPG